MDEPRSYLHEVHDLAVDPRTALHRRLAVAFLFLMTVLLAGTVGFRFLGRGTWDWFSCFYMTVVTLSTVGFAETLPGIERIAGARTFTVVLIVLGSGTLLYFVSTFTAFVVEGDLVGALKRTRMLKRIKSLEGHVVVCGVGSTGVHIIEELAQTDARFVAVDADADRLAALDLRLGKIELLYVVGDATDDETLREAGVERAKGVIAALHDDKDNVFATITARALNQDARIVAKAVESSADAKLRRAGADAVVSPNRIGGMRLVSEMVRPSVVAFLDDMLRDHRGLRFEEVLIPPSSPLAGARLRDTDIRRATNVLVIAFRTPDGSFFYNPGPDAIIEAGATLVVLAEPARVRALMEGVEQGTIGRSSA